MAPNPGDAVEQGIIPPDSSQRIERRKREIMREHEAAGVPMDWDTARVQAVRDVAQDWRRERALSEQAQTGDGAALAELLGTWAPVSDSADLIDQLIDGTLEESLPSLVDLEGGGHLLYPGQVHSIAGEPGSGKSWLAMHAAAQVLREGGSVLYFDVETNKPRTYQRMLSIGATRDELLGGFNYAHPTESIDATQVAMIAHVMSSMPGPLLVVIDSVGEAISLEGLNPDSDEVAGWVRTLPRRLSETGAAVLMVDHLPKSQIGSKTTFAIGSQRKKAAIDVQFMLDAKRPFSRTQAGTADVRVAKDRDGNFTTGAVVADMHVTPRASGVEIRLCATEARTPEEKADARREALTARIWWAVAHGYASANAVRSVVGGKSAEIKGLVQQMLREGLLVESGHYRRPLTVSHPPHLDEADVVLDQHAVLDL